MFHYGPPRFGHRCWPFVSPAYSNGVALKMYYVILGAALVALIVVFFVVRKKGE